MNNDPSSSAAADLPPDTADSEDTNATRPIAPAQDQRTPAQKRLQAQSQKKNNLLKHLLENLDSIIYMELCILYYMDNSLFRLLIRAINQLMFLTPKPAFLPPAPQARPFIGAIFIPNILCILLHILTAHSSASEEMRGYLHGGVILDLIGQKGPTSKIHLVLLDLLVWGLQCVMLAVVLEKERVGKVLDGLKGGVRIEPVVAEEARARGEAGDGQDADTEERGVTRHGVIDTNEIELSDLSTSPNQQRDEEREQLLAEPAVRPEDEASEDPLDIFYSRTALLATFNVLPTLRSQWQEYGNATGSALQTVGFSAEFARVAASRRLGAAGQRLQRQVESRA